MNAAQVFELSITYDEAELRAAARMLFWRHWKSRLWMSLLSVIGMACISGTFIYFRFFSMLWCVALYFVVSLILWAYVFWVTERRTLRLLGKSVNIRMTQADFSVMTEGDTHTFLWKRFKSFQQDRENFYLFIFKSIAYILPISQVGEPAVEFAKDQVSVSSDQA
jgi:YcxB-like protein